MLLRHNFLIRLVFIVTGIVGLLVAIGYLITEMVVADYPKQFSKIDKSLTQVALISIHIFLDNPIERLVIQKYQIVSLEFKGPPVKQFPPEGLLDDLPIEHDFPEALLGDNKRYALGKLKQSFVPEGFPTSHLLSSYKVKIRAYTLFAIPVTTVSIWMEGPNFSRCKRL